MLLTVLFAESSDRAAFPYAEATRGSLHPASLLTLLVGGLFSPDYAVPYWGPYSVAWDPKRLFLSPNMSQLYAGTLPMLAILTLRPRARPRLDARGPLLLARRARSRSSTRSAATRRSIHVIFDCCRA